VATSRPVHERLWKSLKTIPLMSLALLTMLVFEAVSIFFSVDPSGSQKNYSYQLFAYVVPFLIAAGFVRARRDVEILVYTLVFCTGIVGLITFAETIAHRNLYGGFFGKWLNYDAAWLKGVWFGDWRSGKYRAFGPFMVHLSLAEFFILAMPFVLYCLEIAKRGWMKLFFWATLALSMYGVYATDSRTSLIAALCILAAYVTFKGFQFISEKKESRLRPLAALAILGLVVAAPAGIGLVFAKIGWENAFGEGGTRSTQLAIGVPKVKHSPLIGYGVGNAGLVLDYRPDGYTATIDNYYLSLALDSGLPAMLAFTFLPFSMVYIGFRRAMRKTRDSPLFLAFALSALGFALVRVTLSQYENLNFFHILMGAFVALVLLIREESASEAPEAGSQARRRRRGYVGDERWIGRGPASNLG
jgi:O-antigen ligase